MLNPTNEAKRIVDDLRSALEGSDLAGLPNLGNRQVVLQAARVRGDAAGRLIWPVSAHEELETLVLLPDGALAVAICKTGKTGQLVPAITFRAIGPNELTEKDVFDLWRTLVVVLPKHIVKVGGGSPAIRELLARALDRIDPPDEAPAEPPVEPERCACGFTAPVNETPQFKVGDRVKDRALARAGTVLAIESAKLGGVIYVVALDKHGADDDGHRRLGACWLAPLHAER